MTRRYDAFTATFEDRQQWTLPQVLAVRARQQPNKIYLEVPHQSVQLSYSQVLQEARTVAGHLIMRGGKREELVCIFAHNCAEFVSAWFGAVFAGMVEAPINVDYRGNFLAHQVSLLAPRFMVVQAELMSALLDVKQALESIECLFVIGDAQRAAPAMAAAEAAGLKSQPFSLLRQRLLQVPALPEAQVQDMSAIFCTSGTTGPSKGVMTTHAHNYLFADACVSLTRMKADDVYYSPLPLFHANAQFLTAYAAMIAGGRYVMGERFSASAWLGAVRECGATHTNLLGVMMDYVWKQPPTSEDADNKLRCVFAAPVNFRIVEEFKKRFDIEAFVDVFGSTEIGIPILTPYNVPRPQGSFGLAMTDLYDMKLVDPETDQEVPAGELGELVIRPKIAWTLTQGYYRRPEATVAAFRNLWFHTGDGLRQDSEGWFYWVDRLKDAIRRKGENISSAEIEQAVLAMDGIIECAAIAVPADEGEGEDEVMLYVVREPGATIEAEAVWAWCDSKVPRFAVPRFIEFIGALPKTPTGKIQKVQLRNLAAAQPRPKERATPSKR